MSKLILITLAIGSFMYAGTQGDINISTRQDSADKQYNWSVDTSDDYKAEAGRRRGKGNRGRRRGGSGLR